MPSLNIDLDYIGHPKVAKLKAAIGYQADCFPIRLWTYAGKFFPADGVLINHTGSQIEAILDWRGDPGQLIASMLLIGMLDGQEPNYRVHDWIEHQGHIEAFKARAKAGAKAKWDKLKVIDATSNALSNATSILEAMPQHDMALHSSSIPSFMGDDLKSKMRRMLKTAGVAGKNLDKCLSVAGLHPIHVADLIDRSCGQGIKNPAGWMVTQLDGIADPPIPDVKRISKISRWIEKIEGNDVNGKGIQFNDNAGGSPGGFVKIGESVVHWRNMNQDSFIVKDAPNDGPN